MTIYKWKYLNILICILCNSDAYDRSSNAHEQNHVLYYKYEYFIVLLKSLPDTKAFTVIIYFVPTEFENNNTVDNADQRNHVDNIIYKKECNLISS